MKANQLKNKVFLNKTTATLFCLSLMINFTDCSCDCESSNIKLLEDTPTEEIKIEDLPTPFQEALIQYSTDNVSRAEDDFYMALRNGSGAVSGNSYQLNLYYTDHISDLDYYVKVPGFAPYYTFRSFDDGSTFRVLHAGAVDDTSVEVIFNRDVNNAFAVPANFDIQDSGGSPLSITGASRDGTELNVILLTVNPQTDDEDHTLTVSGSFQDSSGNPLGSTFNTASFTGYTAGAPTGVLDAYMRTSGQIRIVFNNTAPVGTYRAFLKLNGVMRWREDSNEYTYANVISIQNYGFLIALERRYNPAWSYYSELLDFCKIMGENLKILGQPIVGKSGLDRRRCTDTSYLTKLYELTGDSTYLDQAKFNFDNEIGIFSYSGLTGGEAWARLMIDVRYNLAGYDAGSFMYSALSIAMIDPDHVGVKDFADKCAAYMINNETEWDEDDDYYGTDYYRLSIGDFCFRLTELVRLYPDLAPGYAATITSYITDILSWQTVEGYFEDTDGNGFNPQVTAFCLLALKGAGSEYGVPDDAIQGAVDYLMEHYQQEGTDMGGWYYNDDPNADLYNEEVSELIWALSW